MKKTMRLFMVVLLGIFLLLAGSVVQAQASPYAVVMDEYGPGYYKDLGIPNGPWHVWNGALRADTTWPGHSCLSYAGAYTPFVGYFDVLVKDPSGADSDMLRYIDFPNFTAYTVVQFYSADTGGGAPADTGLPPAASWNVKYTVDEDSNGVFHWTSPLSGNEFTGYSIGHASVPEPTTMLLLSLGLVGLAGVRRRFQN